MRAFAALVPPPEAVEHLEDFLAVRRDAADFRWSTVDQFHITLAFMAAVEEWRLDDYAERLAESLVRVPVTAVRLAGPVSFPNPAAARVLGVGLVPETEDGGHVLQRLAGRARSAAVASGIEVDGQRFRPHLTLARMRQPGDISNWVRLLETYAGPVWAADTVHLVVSHLGEGPRGRPRYEVVAEIGVGGSTPQ